VITEDLGRILRRLQAHMFCEACVDNDVRLIALNDHVDTAVDGWQDRSIFSAWHHERSNRDTSERIKRAHAAGFERGGCLPPHLIFGYVKPPGAKFDSECSKDPSAEAIYKEWFERLDRGQAHAEIADWLNETGVPRGPGARHKEWDGPSVGTTTHNPILKGWRYRNKRKSRRNSKGQYESVAVDPADTLWRHVPHLAFFDEEYYDRVVAKDDEANARCTRARNGKDVRKGVSRKRTRFPGQSLRCGVCGRLFVFGGHGQKNRLMCDGARQYRCWNAVTIDGPLAAERIVAAVIGELESLPEFDEVFLAEVNAEADRLDAGRAAEVADLERRIDRLEREVDRYIEFIAAGNGSKRVAEKLASAEAGLDAAIAERERLRRRPTNRIEIPSAADVRALAEAEVGRYAVDDPALVRLMRTLAPRIVVFPHRLCDGGGIEHRARLRLHLARLLPDERASEALDPVLERLVTVDLFDPPQREQHREAIVRLRAAGNAERQAAKACGITQTAAQRAAALQRRMEELGIVDPWVPVLEPPEELTKLRRHRHARYRFEPLDDAGTF
jgi:site-specific DNA recombinase